MTQTDRPSTDAVSKLVMSLLSSRRYRDFSLNSVEYVFFPSAYNLKMSWNGRDMELKIPAELVEEAISTGDTFKQRKIKSMIKNAYGDHDED